jgi:predicted nucleotidyltransferase component of viral defense system
MKTPVPNEINRANLFVWLMHRIIEEFREHAILKGGMALRLLDCPRQTNDLDYVFVPYKSKNEVAEQLNNIAQEIPSAKIISSIHSSSFRLGIQVSDVALQIEVNVAKSCPSTVLTTQTLARSVGVQARTIRVMSFDVALAHKLAAWNERRLMRDLYDIYFLFQVQNQMPDIETLQSRLKNIHSQIPRLKTVKQMRLSEFLTVLEEQVNKLELSDLKKSLDGLLEDDEIVGLDRRIKSAVHRLVIKLRA